MSNTINASTDHFRQVRDWMRAAGSETPLHPTVPDDETRALRCRLLLEETLEFIEASGFCLVHQGLYMDINELDIKIKDTNEPIDLAHLAKEMADVQFVNLGNMIAYGIPDKPLMEEVCANNFYKVSHPDYPSTIENGKVVKNKNLPKPNVQRIIDLATTEETYEQI